MVLGLALGLAAWLAWMPVQAADGEAESSPSAVADPAEPAYVGVQVCAECHPQEAARWRGSDHDRAMTEAGSRSVLGDFNDTTLTAHGLTSRFFRRDGRYWVETQGPTGAPETYPIRYTFGWRPLQQYLIAFPGGRLQSLGLAWDSRDREDGGQRWFQLYPDERIDATHPLHWTGREQNWNYQCAECHSTNLRKGYDLATDSFRTTWSEINVACEACHGPGARHVAQARSDRGDGTPAWDRDKGLTVALGENRGAVWLQDDATGQPQTLARARDASRTQRLRPLSLTAGLAPRGRDTGRTARRQPSTRPARHRPVSRRRPDPGRGLRVRLLSPKPDVPAGCHLFRLSRPA
ncbi:MAG: cytochrome c family protein [Chromatiales bacterium]|nr:cytochrome c family protein [Chromatiales bacterium]